MVTSVHVLASVNVELLVRYPKLLGVYVKVFVPYEILPDNVISPACGEIVRLLAIVPAPDQVPPANTTVAVPDRVVALVIEIPPLQVIVSLVVLLRVALAPIVTNPVLYQFPLKVIVRAVFILKAPGNILPVAVYVTEPVPVVFNVPEPVTVMLLLNVKFPESVSVWELLKTK